MAPVPTTPGPASPGRDLLAGLVTSLALIPEVVSFSIVAGVNPAVGLLSSFTFAVVISVLGGRPAMVSAAAGSMALVAAPLVHGHGVGALAAATVLAGVLQLGLVRLGIHRLIAQLPASVVIGFVNGLAILIFVSNVRQIDSVTAALLVVGGAGLLTGLRRVRLPVPPSLLSTAVVLLVAVIAGLRVTTVGDEGALPTGLPHFHSPGVPTSLHTLAVIAPTAISLALVGLVESLLTANIVDRMTTTRSSRRREGYGQGVANLITGFFGGQPGCAMIGQSILCVESGGRGRLATCTAGAWLLILVVALHPVMKVMPVAALVATMVVVAAITFDWKSVQRLAPGGWPLRESLIVAFTTAVIVITNNLAIGVIAGTAAAGGVLIARAGSRTGFTRRAGLTQDDGVHRVRGQLSFMSIGALIAQLEHHPTDRPLRIDLSEAEIVDSSASLALEDLLSRQRSSGGSAELLALTPSSEDLHRRLSRPGPESPAPTAPGSDP
jgi:SulP family sulfate permease